MACLHLYLTTVLVFVGFFLVISIPEDGREHIVFCEMIPIDLPVTLPAVCKMRRCAVSRS
jgi:hypothetical protein